jgi:hypothetical protein
MHVTRAKRRCTASLHAIALLILQVKIVQKQVTAAKKEKRGTDG